jgi:hypothetical protein
LATIKPFLNIYESCREIGTHSKINKNENKTIKKDQRDSGTPRRSESTKEDHELKFVIKPSSILGTKLNKTVFD